MTIGVVCPSRFEHEVLQKTAWPAGVELVYTGMGKVRSSYAVTAWAARRERVRAVVLAGFAGSLTPALRVGDVIEPSVVVEQDYDARPFERFPNRIRLSARRLVSGSRDAVMLTQDRFLTSNPYAGSAYARRHPRLACDMESYAVAYTCRQAALPLHIIKLISDTADENADHDFLKACRRLSGRLTDTVLEAVRRLGAGRVAR